MPRVLFVFSRNFFEADVWEFYYYFHVVPFTIDKTADYQGRRTGYLPARWSKELKMEFTGRKPIVNLLGSGKRYCS